MPALFQDIRFAFRGLSKHWLVSLLAALSLALAVAGNTVVFSMVESFLFRRLPFEDAENLLLIWMQHEERQPPADFNLLSTGDLVEIRDRAQSFQAVAGYRAAPLTLGGGDQVEPVTAEQVTPDLFPLLGVRAFRGRVFSPEEARVKVALIGHRLWQERFGGDPGVLGETVLLDSEPYQVLGVMAEDFGILSPNVDVWVPLAIELDDLARERRDLFVFARLLPGRPLTSAQAEIATISDLLQEEFPVENAGMAVRLERFHERIPHPINRPLFGLLQAATFFVLLIAAANVANLLLARGFERRREVAMRTVLGAGRSRILRQMLTESILLATVAGGIGVLLALGAIRFISASFGRFLPPHWLPELDPGVLIFSLVLTVASGLLFGTAPALQAMKVDFVEILKEGDRGGVGRSRRIVSKGLVVAQVALAAVMLTGAITMIQAFQDLQNVDSTVDSEQILTFQLSLPRARYPDDERTVDFINRLSGDLGRLPNVDRAALASLIPRSPIASGTRFEIDERPVEAGRPWPAAVTVRVTDDYFRTLDVSLLKGRLFERGDRLDGAPVALISQSMANLYWAEDDPLGRRLTVAGQSREIVGVVGDVLQSFISLGQGPQATIYLPMAQNPQRIVSALLHTPGDPHALAESIRRAVRNADADLSIGQMQTHQEFVDQFYVGINLFSSILTSFGLLALGLASVGIYGVLAYSTAQRRHEIGVRMAAGARPGNILYMVTRQGVLLGGLGLLIAAPLAILTLQGVQQTLSTFTSVSLSGAVGIGVVLLGVIVLASYLPARRASAVDPIQALRSD